MRLWPYLAHRVSLEIAIAGAFFAMVVLSVASYKLLERPATAAIKRALTPLRPAAGKQPGGRTSLAGAGFAINCTSRAMTVQNACGVSVQLSEVRNTRRPASSNRCEQCALRQEQCQLQEWQFDCAPIGAAGSRHADCAARTD